MISNYKSAADLELRSAALEGDSKALGQLIENHQNFLYNVIWRMILSPVEAEDITQDVIIKIITNLAKFRSESAFRTWIYRIAFNHVINLPKTSMEKNITTFEKYGEDLDVLPDQMYPADGEPTPEDKMVINDVMYGCTAGMLMCLDRQQRLVYILGEVFEMDAQTASEILGTSNDNYRQLLSRARRQLYNFMDNKCGLINKSNPCRCQKKTRSFIDFGWVDPKNLKFNAAYKRKINEMVKLKHDEMSTTIDESYQEIFQNQPFQEKNQIKQRIEEIIKGKDFRQVFDL
ncbi:RNA polymerase sigma factor [Fulvivirgaceae bacterium BMA10]|uniref:RNA polymerase sigma factor n=1 Tax=Splendidivirga corallicola TaxID=3051826 RepID=A0ABT8KI09_9BACT|nr:RNA polymerase sigma factor [Fulvivirgaceae bacterium BMA10]